MHSVTRITQRASQLTHTLAIHVEQVTDGKLRCDYCSRPAAALVATGADPMATPHCRAHAAVMLYSMSRVFADANVEAVSPLSERTA